MAGSGTAHLRDEGETMLRVDSLEVEFRTRHGPLRAVSGVSLDVLPGETVGVVGESGSGKSTAARAILQLPRPRAGSVTFEGADLTRLRGEALRRVRTRLQMIFQDPISSLNPRRSVREIVAEGLRIWGAEPGTHVRERVDEMLRVVGLDPAVVGDRRPYELSGGQCQRVAIGRALLLNPALIICDEAVSALDVSVQAQILNLLEDMKQRYGLSLVFISHDLAVVKHMSDRVVVMYLGKVCEVAPPNSLYASPAHPYSQLLMRSIPRPDADAPHVTLGELPSPMRPPSGCRFRTRCPIARDRCAREEPAVREIGVEHFVACHFPTELAEQSLNPKHSMEEA